MICSKCKATIKKRKPVKRRHVVRPKQVDLSAAESIEITIKHMIKTGEHYVHVANKIREYHEKTGYSERTMASWLGISKSEIHRMVLISYMDDSVKHAALMNNTEKYVLLEWDELRDPQMKNYLRTCLVSGVIRLRKQLKQRINKYAIEFGQRGASDNRGPAVHQAQTTSGRTQKERVL